MMEELPFTPAKRTCRAPNNTPPIRTTTTNSFGVFTNQEEMETETQIIPATTNSNTNTNKKISPVVVTQRINSYTEFHNKLKIILKNHFYIRYNKSEIKITPTTEADKNKLIQELQLFKMEYYTFTPRDQRRKKIVVKAASFMSEQEVKDEIIRESGFQANEVQCTKLRGTLHNSAHS